MEDPRTEDQKDMQAALTLLRALWVHMSEDNAGMLRLHAKLDGVLVGKQTQAYYSYMQLAERGLLIGEPPIPLPGHPNA